MKLFELFEAPITDFQMVGKWDDDIPDDKRNFSHKVDRDILHSKKAVDKIIRQFGKSSVDINMYFVDALSNDVRRRDVRETGVASDIELKNFVGEETFDEIKGHIKDSNAINVVYVDNEGDNRKQLSAWILAHRLGHALRESGFWPDDQKLVGGVIDILEYFYGGPSARNLGAAVWNQHKELFTDFFYEIGTMKSARDKNLGVRPYEFFYECFAQYLLTGKIAFNRPPEQFKSFFIKSKYEMTGNSLENHVFKLRSYNGDIMPFVEQELERFRKMLEKGFQTALEQAKGEILVM